MESRHTETHGFMSHIYIGSIIVPQFNSETHRDNGIVHVTWRLRSIVHEIRKSTAWLKLKWRREVKESQQDAVVSADRSVRRRRQWWSLTFTGDRFLRRAFPSTSITAAAGRRSDRRCLSPLFLTHAAAHACWKKKQNNKNVHMKVPQWRPRVGGADEDSDTERTLMLKWQSERFIFWDTTGKIGIVFYLFPVRIEEKLKKSYFPKVSELKTLSTLMNTLCFSVTLVSLRFPTQTSSEKRRSAHTWTSSWRRVSFQLVMINY